MIDIATGATFIRDFGLPLAALVIILWGGARRMWVWGYRLKEEQDHYQVLLAERDKAFDKMVTEKDARFSAMLQEKDARFIAMVNEKDAIQRRQRLFAGRGWPLRHDEGAAEQGENQGYQEGAS